MILNILLALFVLNIMVIAHELGHYLLARKNGIGVHEFAIGFGPTLFKRQWRGTLWLIKAFPLGGYNGLKGEMEEEEGSGNFATASKKAKLQVLLAGSLMNILLAIVAFYIALPLYNWKVPAPVEFKPVGAVISVVGGNFGNEYGAEHPYVTAILAESPMSKLGVVPPFSILTVNGKETVTPQDVITEISTSVSDTITMKIVTAEGTLQEVAVQRNAEKKIGINMVPAPVQLDYSTNVLHKAFSGVTHVVNMSILTGKMLSAMFSFSVRTGDLEPLGYAFAGPVAIVAAVGTVVDNSRTIFADLANMTGLIGVSLALFNLLPFPGLDGWHIFLVLYEKAKGRKPNEKVVNIITAIGLFFLLSLGVIIMLKDVWMFFLRR